MLHVAGALILQMSLGMLVACNPAPNPATAVDSGSFSDIGLVDTVPDVVVDVSNDAGPDVQWGACKAVYTDVFPSAEVMAPEVTETIAIDYGPWCTPTSGPAKKWKAVSFYRVGYSPGYDPCAACGGNGMQHYQVRNDGQWRMLLFTYSGTAGKGGIDYHALPPSLVTEFYGPSKLFDLYDPEFPLPTISGTLSSEDLKCINDVISNETFQHSITCSTQICNGPWDAFICHDFESCGNGFGSYYTKNFEVLFEDGSKNYEQIWGYGYDGIYAPGTGVDPKSSPIQGQYPLAGDLLGGCYGPHISHDPTDKVKTQYKALFACSHVWDMLHCNGL